MARVVALGVVLAAALSLVCATASARAAAMMGEHVTAAGGADLSAQKKKAKKKKKGGRKARGGRGADMGRGSSAPPPLKSTRGQ